MQIADFDKPLTDTSIYALATSEHIDNLEPYNSKEFSPCDFKAENGFLKGDFIDNKKMKKLLLDNFDEIHARSKKVYHINGWIEKHMYYDPVSKIAYHYVFGDPVYSNLTFHIKDITFHD